MPGFEGYDLWHNENGSITFQCTPTLAGTYKILVEHDGVPLQGLPVCCVVQEAGEGFVTAYKAGPEADMEMDVTPNVNTIVEEAEKIMDQEEPPADNTQEVAKNEEESLVGAVAMEITDIPEEIEDIKPIVDLGVIVPDGSKYILEKAEVDTTTETEEAPVYILKEHDPEQSILAKANVTDPEQMTFDPADVPVTFVKPAEEATHAENSPTVTPEILTSESQIISQTVPVSHPQYQDLSNTATPPRSVPASPGGFSHESPGMNSRSFLRNNNKAPIFKKVNIKASELNAQTFTSPDMPIFIGPKPSPAHRKVNYDVVKMAEMASKLPKPAPTPPRSKIMIMNKELTIEPIEIDEATRSLIASIPDNGQFGNTLTLGVGDEHQAAEIKYEFIESTTGNPEEATGAILVVPDDITTDPSSAENEASYDFVPVKPDPDLPHEAESAAVTESVAVIEGVAVTESVAITEGVAVTEGVPVTESATVAENPVVENTISEESVDKEPEVTAQSPTRQSRRVSERVRRSFKCRKPGCGETFSNQKELDEHNSTHNQKGVYARSLVDSKKVLTTKNKRAAHKRKNHDEDTADEEEKKDQGEDAAKDTGEEEEEVEKETSEIKMCKKASDSLDDAKAQKKKFLCSECGKMCLNRSALRRHLEGHKEAKSYKCQEEDCDKEFKTQKLLDLHLTKHMEGLWCALCSKAFLSAKSMEKHNRKVHRPKKPKVELPVDSLDCPTCGKTLGNKNSLQKHIINVHGDTRYECETCQKVCKTKENLDRHKKTHLGVKPFMCDLCGQFFKSKDILRCHREGMHKMEQVWEVPVGSDKPILVERTARPFSCKYCDRTFKRRAVLKEHIAIHESTDSIECTHPGCTKTFPTTTLMKTHIRSVHKFRASNRPCTHPGCGKVFKTSSALSVHMNSHLNVRYQCLQEGCELSFTTKHHMLMHYQLKHTQMEKNYACSLCGKRFCLKEQVKAHLDSHKTERKFACDVCGKAFTTKSRLTSHSKIHRTQGDHVCPHCGKCFIRKYRLLDHMNRHTENMVQYEYVTVST